MRLARLLVLAAPLALAACNAKPEAETAAASDAAAKASAPAERLTLGADGLPRFREGLWEVTKIDGGEREVTKRCTGAEVNQEMREMLTRETPDCKTDRSSGPLGIRVHAVCDQGKGLKTETTMTMSGSSTSWSSTLGLYVVTPDGRRDGGEMTMKARWIGACPAGVKPGEDVEG
ncbi:DUF3617 domain-containing protein [Phenylobacterium sp. VNQ135]|uniref:DUF3617 domain-containing protein n=1 Tax=Phenylobacterium sp. VNQ135 TaxID=3400922 RepID=UPI003C0C884A